MLIAKHNDLDQIAAIRAMDAQQITDLVASGHYNVTTLDADPKQRYQDIPLAGEWVLSYYSSRDRTSPEYGLVRVTIHSKSPNNRRAKQMGEQRYAELCGLTNDYAYNWRNSYIPTRYRLLPALVVLATDEAVRNYLLNPPSAEVLLNRTQYNNWLLANPSTDPNIVTLTQGDYADLNRLAAIVLRDALTYEERHELREDHFERMADKRNESYVRRACPARRTEDSKESKPRKEWNNRSSNGYASKQHNPTPKERMANESTKTTVDGKDYWQRAGIVSSLEPISLESAKPDHERRRSKRQPRGKQEQRRKDQRWQ